MKKRSSLILIIAALLCFCVLLASCNLGGKTEETQATEDTVASDQETSTDVPEEPIPENETINYANIIGEWTKYLQYDSNAQEDDEDNIVVNYYTEDTSAPIIGDDGMIYRTVVEVESGMTMDYRYMKRITTTLYNSKTGKMITSWTVVQAESMRDLGDFSEENANYSEKYTYSRKGCIIEVRKASWQWDEPTLNELGELVPPTTGAYSVYSYDYYDIDGNKLNEIALSEPEYIYVNSEQNTCSVLGKGYYIRNNEIIKTFDAGEEIWLPEFDYEYKDRGYIFSGNTIYVYDMEYNPISQYSIPNDSDSYKMFVLTNGNIMLRKFSKLPADALTYTYEYEEEKFSEKYYVYDVATGAVKEISTGYIMSAIVTEAESKGINGFTVKGDWQFATIYKITDGKLAVDPTFAILDGDLKITAELPLIAKNQNDVIGAISQTEFLIKTKTNWVYSVNVINNSIQLYYSYEDVSSVKGGFIKDGVLYSENLTKLADLTGKSYEIIGGKALLVQESDLTWTLMTIKSNMINQTSFTEKPTYLVYGDIECLRTSTALYKMNGTYLVGGASLSIVGYTSGKIHVMVVDDYGTEIHYIVCNEKGR